MQSVSEFDHTLILVSDLDDADARMRRLGFRPTPRGVHSAHMGTANSTIMLSDMTYFEVIGVLNPTPSNEGMRRMLERGPGLLGYAVKTSDVGATLGELEAVSANDGGVIEFSRPVELPDGTRDAAFSIIGIDPAKALGLKMFACQHHTPDVVWREDYLEQPNGVCGVTALLGAAPDPGQAAAPMSALFDGRVVAQDDEVAVRFDNVTVSFLTPDALADRFGLEAYDEPALHVLRLATRDPDLTRRTLNGNHVVYEDRGEDTLRVSPQDACGAMIEFVPA